MRIAEWDLLAVGLTTDAIFLVLGIIIGSRQRHLALLGRAALFIGHADGAGDPVVGPAPQHIETRLVVHDTQTSTVFRAALLACRLRKHAAQRVVGDGLLHPL